VDSGDAYSYGEVKDLRNIFVITGNRSNQGTIVIL
jgi:hypothetical protein